LLRKDKLVGAAVKSKYDRVKFKLSYPYDSKKEFGLTFVEIFAPAEKHKPKPPVAVPTATNVQSTPKASPTVDLGAFKMKPKVDRKLSIAMMFQRQGLPAPASARPPPKLKPKPKQSVSPSLDTAGSAPATSTSGSFSSSKKRSGSAQTEAKSSTKKAKASAARTGSQDNRNDNNRIADDDYDPIRPVEWNGLVATCTCFLHSCRVERATGNLNSLRYRIPPPREQSHTEIANSLPTIFK
jgi:hypothetical protein